MLSPSCILVFTTTFITWSITNASRISDTIATERFLVLAAIFYYLFFLASILNVA